MAEYWKSSIVKRRLISYLVAIIGRSNLTEGGEWVKRAHCCLLSLPWHVIRATTNNLIDAFLRNSTLRTRWQLIRWRRRGKKQYRNEKSSQTLLHYQQTSIEETAGILMAANVCLREGNFHSIKPETRFAPETASQVLSFVLPLRQGFMILLRTFTSEADVGRFLSSSERIHPRCLPPLNPKHTAKEVFTEWS